MINHNDIDIELLGPHDPTGSKGDLGCDLIGCPGPNGFNPSVWGYDTRNCLMRRTVSSVISGLKLKVMRGCCYDSRAIVEQMV